MEVRYLTNNEIGAEEIIRVFESVGWNKDRQVIVEAFQNSFYITAYVDDLLVGFSRAISDRHFYTGIYDVVVDPAYQGKGIAKKMVQTLVDEFRGTYFFLSYTEGNDTFYEKVGFQKLDTAMWIPKM